MNLQLNDPTLPPPGEIVVEEQPAPYRTASPQPISSPMPGDPHHLHLRTPSLGEIHQELEQEQEAQVVCHFHDCSHIAYAQVWTCGPIGRGHNMVRCIVVACTKAITALHWDALLAERRSSWAAYYQR